MNGDIGARRSGADTHTHASPRPSASALKEDDFDRAARDTHARDHASPEQQDSKHVTRDPRDSDQAAIGSRNQQQAASGVHSSLTERGYARLSKLLIGKSVAETILLVALVAFFSYTHFNPRMRGVLDVANEREVSGWAFDASDPARRVEVELYIDEHFVARRRADTPRPDVLAAGRAPDAAHGFTFETPPLPARDAPYEARVFAVSEGPDRDRIGMQMIGRPLRFTVRPNSKSAGAPERWWEGLEKR